MTHTRRVGVRKFEFSTLYAIDTKREIIGSVLSRIVIREPYDYYCGIGQTLYRLVYVSLELKLFNAWTLQSKIEKILNALTNYLVA